MPESYSKRPAEDRLEGSNDGKRLRQTSPPPQNVEEFPSFLGKTVQRGDLGYTAATYQYATSGRLGVWGPSAVIYASKDNNHSDIKKAIDYAVQHKLSIAVRSGGHQYLGFSSTTDQNIQIDMSEYDYWDESNVAKEKGSTLIMGPKWRLSDIAKKCTEVGRDVLSALVLLFEPQYSRRSFQILSSRYSFLMANVATSLWEGTAKPGDIPSSRIPLACLLIISLGLKSLPPTRRCAKSSDRTEIIRTPITMIYGSPFLVRA
jgi:hypothetical protein